MKNIMETLKTSTSLMMVYAGLSVFSLIAGVFWNITVNF